jgi:hypothetical protein
MKKVQLEQQLAEEETTRKERLFRPLSMHRKRSDESWHMNWMIM